MDECLAVGREREAWKLEESGLRWVVLLVLHVLILAMYAAWKMFVLFSDFQLLEMKVAQFMSKDMP
jgi:hypothetical protein